MDISVCIVTRNRAKLLARTLESIRDASYPREQIEILVVDSQSTDATREVAESARTWFGNFRYVFEAGQGLAYSRNAAVRASHGAILCFLDDDKTIDANYFIAVHDAFAGDRCAGVAARILPKWDGAKPRFFATEGPYNVTDGLIASFDPGDRAEELQQPWLGAGMSISRAALNKHGLFAEHLSRTGKNAETDANSEMFSRLKAAGEKILYVPEAVVFHPVDAENLDMKVIKKWRSERGIMLGLADPRQYRSFRGIPLWAIRRSLRYGLCFLASLDVWKRAYYEALMWESLGTMQGYLKRNHKKASGPTEPRLRG